MIKYPIYQPRVEKREKELVNDCLDSGWISSRGKYVGLFEEKLTKFANGGNTIAMHNGTHPLHIACLLAGVDSESEVILPVFSYVATANVVAYCRAKPIFVDVRGSDWNIDVAQIEQQITKRTKAIIAVDIYGCPADYDALKEIARKHSICLIADAAESIGGMYKGEPVGSLGDISTFSFFGNKTVTTGEGGALLTDNDKWSITARKLINQGNSLTKKYFHEVLGYNYRMTNIQAAIGLAQMENLDETLKRKRVIYNRYKENLRDKVVFQDFSEGISSSFWLVSFCLPSTLSRDKLIIELAIRGIETRPFFTSMDQLPYFETGVFPVAHDLSKRGISVPSYPQLTIGQVDDISEHIIDCLNKY